MKPRRRLLSIAHSYVVAANRRLVHELALAAPHWEVGAVAPTYFRGGGQDLGPVHLERADGPAPYELFPVQAYGSRKVHVFVYGRGLRKAIARGWDLVHCWEEPYIFVGGQVAGLVPRETPLVFRTAQSISKRYLPPFGWIERFAMARAAGWICSGRLVEQTLSAREGYSNRPRRRIPLGVDLERFHPDPSRGLSTRRALGWHEPGPPVIGFLGRLVEEKGVRLLMSALGALDVAWRALFVGAGPLEPELRTWARRWPERVRICVDVKHAQVPEYLNAMDVLCAPSQTTGFWKEQFGRMLIEGFASGVPVVGSDSGEIPHVLGDAGIVVEEADRAAWTRALGGLVSDASARAEYGSRGLEQARTKYSWPTVAREYIGFFEELLEAKRGGIP